MKQSKVKIVLDADVIIHFVKGGLLSVLPNFFPEHRFVVLDYVREELKGNTRHQLDMQVEHLRNIEECKFAPTGEALGIYAKLRSKYGKGESACMTYCKTNSDVLGSSNLKDITEYCEANSIVYLTTIDFLYFGIKRAVISKEEACTFIKNVIAKGSKLPDIDFDTFVCHKLV